MPSARRLMLVNICMKFHEGTLNGLPDTTISQNLLFSISKGQTPKIHNPELRFLHSARRLMLLYIYVKLMKISRTVFELQSGHDFVTDGRTDDQGKNNMSPNPTGGDIMR